MTRYIGIDTGTHTGVAVWNGSAFETLTTCPLHKALEIVREHYGLSLTNGDRLVVIFEDARQRKWIPSTGDSRREAGRRMGAGAVKRDAAIWEEFLRDYGIEYIAKGPTAGATKWTAEYFARVTGWKGRTSEHARDAALLVYGK